MFQDGPGALPDIYATGCGHNRAQVGLPAACTPPVENRRDTRAPNQVEHPDHDQREQWDQQRHDDSPDKTPPDEEDRHDDERDRQRRSRVSDQDLNEAQRHPPPAHPARQVPFATYPENGQTREGSGGDDAIEVDAGREREPLTRAGNAHEAEQLARRASGPSTARSGDDGRLQAPNHEQAVDERVHDWGQHDREQPPIPFGDVGRAGHRHHAESDDQEVQHDPPDRSRHCRIRSILCSAHQCDGDVERVDEDQHGAAGQEDVSMLARERPEDAAEEE
jgi:hypothetical protein